MIPRLSKEAGTQSPPRTNLILVKMHFIIITKCEGERFFQKNEPELEAYLQ